MAAVNAPLTHIEESALHKAGFFSLAFFNWVTPYITRGFKTNLEEKDVRKPEEALRPQCKIRN